MEKKEQHEVGFLNPEKIACLPDQQAFAWIEHALQEPQNIQSQVLLDILQQSAQTTIGKRYQFEKIGTVTDFQKTVPISEYSDYHQMITEITDQGSRDLLFSGAVSQFIATSGTTGTPKLFPESQLGSVVKALVSKNRAIKMMMMAKEVMEPDARVLAIANSSDYGVTKSGIRIGSASGQAASDLPPELLKKMVLPMELLLAKDLSNEVSDYLVMFYMLKEENLVGVVASNIAHFELLLDQSTDRFSELSEAIAEGNFSSKQAIPIELRVALEKQLLPDPDRAQMIRQAFEGGEKYPILKIWPKFSVVACWLSSSTGRVARSFKCRMPEQIKFLEWGYGASEGKFNIPDQVGDPAGPFADFGYFFEFLPPGQTKTKLLHELEEKKAYELIITTYSGLYRYNLKDLVWVKEIKGKMPRLEFLSKSAEKVTVNDHNIFVFELDQVLEAVSESCRMGIHFYEVMINSSHLQFFIESQDEGFETKKYELALEDQLRHKNSVYDNLRKNNILQPVVVSRMVNGYRNAKIRRAVMPGKNVNQTKLKTIIEKMPDGADIFS
ncbi:GH3 auxin-responsive promoter family protein [Eubacteriaceae bacterium ES3]|nr:GH3 auxin-responsive promoter family protein [Eubacteriaceae bacterium ES3]